MSETRTSSTRRTGSPRRWRWGKWCALVVTVIVAAVYIASWRRVFMIVTPLPDMTFSRGVLVIYPSDIVPFVLVPMLPEPEGGASDGLASITISSGVSTRHPMHGQEFLAVLEGPLYYLPSPTTTPLHLPAWPAIVVGALGTLLGFWCDRRFKLRIRAGVCAVCGYSLAGLSEGSVCPECGKGA